MLWVEARLLLSGFGYLFRLVASCSGFGLSVPLPLRLLGSTVEMKEEENPVGWAAGLVSGSSFQEIRASTYQGHQYRVLAKRGVCVCGYIYICNVGKSAVVSDIQKNQVVRVHT